MPEKDNSSFEALKLSAANTLKKGLAIGGSVLALAGGTLVREAVFNPAEATAAVECTTTETTTTDGTTTTTTESTHCSDSSETAGDDQPDVQQPPKTPSDQGKGHNQPNNQADHDSNKPHKNNPVHGPKAEEDKTDSQKDFPGYDMENSPFTSGNGCFITSTASALRRETGNSHITPKKIYFPALQKMWSPSAGVKGGLLFDALPSIASNFDVQVYKTNFQGAVKAIKNDDEVTMLAAPGHFTSQGHYMAAWKVAKGGRNLVIDDPNGKGKHGDSERPGGWSGSELKKAGIIGYRVLHLREQ